MERKKNNNKNLEEDDKREGRINCSEGIIPNKVLLQSQPIYLIRSQNAL